MSILNNQQIDQKIQRLAIEIFERNTHTDEIILLGINNNGFGFATLLVQAIKNFKPKANVELKRIRINPASPHDHPIRIESDIDNNFNNKNLILVDDVANTGRTLFYACQPLLSHLPKSIEVAVLVDRKHKSFPIHVNYVGLSLATTIGDHIDLQLEPSDQKSVTLR